MSAAHHLGPFADLPAFLGAGAARRPDGWDPAAVRRALGLDRDGSPTDVRTGRRWSRDGVDGEEVGWSVGYGPRTAAWVLRPAGREGPLPGVLALHDHGGYKWHGKEKIADGPDGPPPEVDAPRAAMYGGRPFADDLARAGFTVLVPDVLMWGSRRVPAEVLPPVPDAGDVAGYNRWAAGYEHVLAKYCALLGTSVAGLVAYEDRVAAAYLRSRRDVADAHLACVGLSGGGARAALLRATDPRVEATVVAGMMSTHRALLDRHVAGHTWMFFPFGLAAWGDWPDLVACRAPVPLLVQYLLDDELFPPAGMRAAHERIAAEYAVAGRPDAYCGEFRPGPHRFDAEMQRSAFAWLTAVTGGACP